MKIQEFTGKTTQEAIDNGLAELGVTIADVHVDVLQEGAKGLFGLFGSKPARVRLTIMEEEFITLGSANVMVSNVTYQTALELSEKLEGISGVSEVVFDDTQEHYKQSSALFTISFDAEETDPATIEAMNQVLEALDGYDVYASTQIGRDESVTLQQE